MNNNGFWCFDIFAPEPINSLYIIPPFYALSRIVYSLLFSINLSRLYIKLAAIRRNLSLALMTIWLSHRYVVLKRQFILKRSSLYQESSCSYFFFFSVGWLCLAKLDESSKFGCFLPALLLLPFPICNAPPLTLTIPNKKILLHPKEFFMRRYFFRSGYILKY